MQIIGGYLHVEQTENRKRETNCTKYISLYAFKRIWGATPRQYLYILWLGTYQNNYLQNVMNLHIWLQIQVIWRKRIVTNAS